MPWLAAPLILGLGKIGSHLLRKPKKYKPDTGWLDKFMAERQSDLATKETRHLIMQGAMKQIGANTATAMENVNYESAQYGLKGTGIDATKKLNILKAGHQASSHASRVAEIEQRKVDTKTRTTLDSAMMMKERILADAKLRNEMAEDQWKQGLGTEIIGGVANIAMTGFADAAAWSKAEGLAKASGFEGNLHDLAGDPQTALQIAGINMEQVQSKSFFSELAGTLEMGVNYNPEYSLQQNLKLLETEIGQEKDEQKKLQMEIFFGMFTNKDLRAEQIDMAVSQGLPPDFGITLYKNLGTGIDYGLIDKSGPIEKHYDVMQTGEKDLTKMIIPRPDEGKIKDIKAGERSFTDMTNTIDIYNQYNTKSPGKYNKLRDDLNNLQNVSYDTLSDDIWDYVESLDIPITGDNSITLPDGKVISFSGNDPATKLWNARKALLKELIKQLGKTYELLGLETKGSILGESSNFDWEP